MYNLISHLVFFTFLFICSALFAVIEIQVEGPNGWATNLPTWKIDNKWTKILNGGRPLTGYHIFLLVFIFFIVHIPYGLSLVDFSLSVESRILSFIILFFVVEDFLWFVLNPAFGLRKFKRENIWWHPHWWGCMPREYWIFIPIGLILYGMSRVF